jgi:nucleotide-binding universal stress UspA family protein
VVEDGRVDAATAIAEAKAILDEAGVTVEVVTLEGSPTAAVAGEIDRRDPDLVVLGTRGHTGFKRLHLGSTAGAIVRSSHCSVLVACADGTTSEH